MGTGMETGTGTGTGGYGDGSAVARGVAPLDSPTATSVHACVYDSADDDVGEFKGGGAARGGGMLMFGSACGGTGVERGRGDADGDALYEELYAHLRMDNFLQKEGDSEKEMEDTNHGGDRDAAHLQGDGEGGRGGEHEPRQPGVAGHKEDLLAAMNTALERVHLDAQWGIH